MAKRATDKDCALILGASKGLGQAIAQETIRRGMIAVGVSRSTVSTFATMRDGWVGRKADLADPSAVIDILELHAALPITHIFWVAGIPPRSVQGRDGQVHKLNLMSSGADDVDAMFRTHLTGPINIFRECMRRAWRTPINFVTIASTSSYRLRENETLYCTVKAAKAHFTRNFSRELARDLSPECRTLLVNPGGMRTDFLKDSADVSKWMDPDAVAKIIWDRLAAQTHFFEEINILRQEDGSPKVVDGPQTPETP